MPQSKQDKSHPSFMPGPSQEKAHTWFSGKNRAWEQKGLRLTVPSIFPTLFSWQLRPTSPQALHDGMVSSPLHHLLRANVRSVLRHICQSSSDPPQRLHKVKSLPVLTLRVMLPLQQCDFLPKIHGRQCFILI